MTTRPAAVNFYMYPHATFSEQVILKDSNDVPLDLSGYSARMQIRRERDDETALYTLTTAPGGGITLGGALGSIAISIGATHTDDAPVDVDGETWFHDILLSNDNVSPAVVSRVYQGMVIVLPGVTVPAGP